VLLGDEFEFEGLEMIEQEVVFHGVCLVS
jgi:hypothetical protein